MNDAFESAGPQFEIMPFGAGGSPYAPQMEEERGTRPGGGGRRGGRGRGKPSSPGRYGRPPPWPVYPAPGWPWPPSYGPSYAPYADEPFPPGANAPFDDGAEGEVTPPTVPPGFPPELRAVLLALPPAERPRYVRIGSLLQAAKTKTTLYNKPGLYLIVFNQGRNAYNGQSSVDVRARLQKHLLCATMLGVGPLVHNHQVYFSPPPANMTARAIERKINEGMLVPKNKGVLTNQRHELEVALLGEAWR